MVAFAEAVLPTNSPEVAETDHFVVLQGVSWETYCAARELFDRPGVRMAYLEGALEIMSPSRRH